MNAFEKLGLTAQAAPQEIKEAYHALVKQCHPDRFSDADAQKKAQEELTRLNLAYEEALKITSSRQTAFHSLPCVRAKEGARKLLEQDQYETALLQLGRAETRDDEWYYLEGRVLMKMKQYASAHQAFREAVRLCPENNDYHAGALEAAVAVRKHQKLAYKVADWADGLLHPRKKP